MHVRHTGMMLAEFCGNWAVLILKRVTPYTVIISSPLPSYLDDFRRKGTAAVGRKA